MELFAVLWVVQHPVKCLLISHRLRQMLVQHLLHRRVPEQLVQGIFLFCRRGCGSICTAAHRLCTRAGGFCWLILQRPEGLAQVDTASIRQNQVLPHSCEANCLLSCHDGLRSALYTVILPSGTELGKYCLWHQELMPSFLADTGDILSAVRGKCAPHL